jgi:hypothetical protein
VLLGHANRQTLLFCPNKSNWNKFMFVLIIWSFVVMVNDDIQSRVLEAEYFRNFP